VRKRRGLIEVHQLLGLSEISTSLECSLEVEEDKNPKLFVKRDFSLVERGLKNTLFSAIAKHEYRRKNVGFSSQQFFPDKFHFKKVLLVRVKTKGLVVTGVPSSPERKCTMHTDIEWVKFMSFLQVSKRASDTTSVTKFGLR